MRTNTFSSRWGIALLPTFVGFLLFSATAFSQHTYYISKSLGSDSNTSTQAQTKSNPWAHLPGMPSCTGNCASYSPVAGDSFILRGGDSWVGTDLGINWMWAGTAASPIYIGVDQTWFSGSSWTRPIWSCGGSACSYTANGNAFFTMGSSVQYLTVDNIEVTGLYQSTAGYPNFFSIYGSYNTFEHIYAHGWSHASAASGAQDNSAAFSSSTCCGGGLGNIVHDVIVDGSDTTGDMLVCFYAGIDTVYNSICRNVTNGFEGSGNNIHDNLFGPINMCFVTGGCHQNNLFQFGPVGAATSVFIYNNVITGTTASGGITKLWLSGNNANTATGYAFNNVIYNNAAGNYVNIAGHNAVNYGTWYLFSNTIECGTDASPGSGSGGCGNDSGGTSGMTFTLHSENNHWITNASPPIACTYSTCTSTTDLVETVATANGLGYTSSESFPFAPTSSSSVTVKTGTNAQSICSTIVGLNATAGAACQNSTTYSCTYNTANHTVSCPKDQQALRPGGTAAWDIGAYQFATAGCSVSPTTVGPYTTGQSVFQQFTSSNCGTSTFTVSSGSLSGSGLNLSSGGLLSGTAQSGSFSFTVAYNTATAPISLTIAAAPTKPSITTSILAAGQVGVAYSQTLSTSGGSGAVTCAVTTGSLPTGLSVNGCTISGTPTAANTFGFSVTPTDSTDSSGSAQAFSILINPSSSTTTGILHTTFCGPNASWPGTCTLSAPTTAGSRLVVVYSSYNSAGSTPVMNSITDGGDSFSELPNARSTNISSATSWNDIWTASNVTGGMTALTITPSTSQTGDVFVWEVQNAPNVVGCSSLSSQPAANPAVGSSMLVGADGIILAHLHPAPGGNPTAVSSPFTSDLISDQMGYAHYTLPASGSFGPQWTQTAETYAAASCGFSAAGSGPNPPSSLTKITQ